MLDICIIIFAVFLMAFLLKLLAGLLRIDKRSLWDCLLVLLLGYCIMQVLLRCFLFFLVTHPPILRATTWLVFAPVAYFHLRAGWLRSLLIAVCLGFMYNNVFIRYVPSLLRMV